MLRQQCAGIITALAIAFVPQGAIAESQPSQSQSSQFDRLEQPLPVKITVTAIGIALIGLELWWFLFSKSQATTAKPDRGVQTVSIEVDNGYDPDRITVNAGEPVRLEFFRKDPNSCLEKVLIPDFEIARDLPLDRVTVIELTPQQPGTYQFTCGMNMFRGELEVRASSPGS
jgi:plastocyanin domain-containing protein